MLLGKDAQEYIAGIKGNRQHRRTQKKK